MREGHITGEFNREEATQENVMTAATGGRDRSRSNNSRKEAGDE
jgi:hypothetical protein